MCAPAGVLAVGAQVKVRALCASVAMPCLYLQATAVAGAGEGWGVWVVQVVQHHGAAVLGPSDGVKLVVIALTQGQKRLSQSGSSQAAGTSRAIYDVLVETQRHESSTRHAFQGALRHREPFKSF